MSLTNDFSLNVSVDAISLDANSAPVASAVVAQPTLQVPARLLEYAPDCYVALPPQVTYGLLENPIVVAVPGAASCAYGLVTWQGARLPLLDISTLVYEDAAEMLTDAPRYALIVAYQHAPRTPLIFAALGLASLPQTIVIGDAAQCPLPLDSKRWVQFSLSCFSYRGQAVPILDTAKLFTC